MKADGIQLVVSDVDGTLATSDKTFTAATVAAVGRLRAAGIGFTIASARPPIGLRNLVATLGLDLPMGAYNGATVVGPDLAVRLSAEGLDFLFCARVAWYLLNPQGPYADLERRTLDAEPRVTEDLAGLLDEASKIVGVSRDHALLAACEGRLQGALGERATIHRSQAYYLDVTPPGLDKGQFVAWLSRHLAIPSERIATFGDAANDRPMFARSGFSVAMGNADEAVKAAARAVTRDNDSDGFAHGVEAFILP